MSWDVNNIFRRSLCIWTINLMSFIDLQQTVFQFPLKSGFFKIFNLFIDWVPHFCACVSNAKFSIVGSYLQETKRQLRETKWQYITIPHNTIQHNTTQNNTTQHNKTQHHAIQYNTIRYNTIKHNTIQYNTIQNNTIQYNTHKARKPWKQGRKKRGVSTWKGVCAVLYSPQCLKSYGGLCYLKTQHDLCKGLLNEIVQLESRNKLGEYWTVLFYPITGEIAWDGTGWIKGNVHHMGYYRVNYPKDTWTELANQLQAKHTVK